MLTFRRNQIHLLLLAALPYGAQAGYSKSANLTFAPASLSAAANITLAFSGSDANLRTVANGGQIQHTVVRAGVTVPTDFALTSDAACQNINSYAWGIEYYDGVNGVIRGWVLIPSLTTGAGVTPTVCVGNPAVTTYQGGAQGTEFDSDTSRVFHLPDGTTLNASDFSSNGANGTNHGATAAAGLIDGGANAAGSGYIDLGSALPSSGVITVSAWVKMNSLAYSKVFVSKGFNGSVTAYQLGTIDSGEGGFGDVRVSFTSYNGSVNACYSSAEIPAGTWHLWVGVYDGTNWKLFKDGAQDCSTANATGPQSNSANGAIGALWITGSFSRVPDAVLDEVRIDSTGRSAGWIATEYANQSSPPVIGAFGSIARKGRLLGFGQ